MNEDSGGEFIELSEDELEVLLSICGRRPLTRHVHIESIMKSLADKGYFTLAGDRMWRHNNLTRNIQRLLGIRQASKGETYSIT